MDKIKHKKKTCGKTDINQDQEDLDLKASYLTKRTTKESKEQQKKMLIIEIITKTEHIWMLLSTK